MIGYITIGTNDIERASRFYDALLSEFGAKRLWENETMIAWGTRSGAAMLCIAKPYNGQAATVGNGVMIALGVRNNEKVDEVYARAIELGATDEGKPGPRAKGFYAGYFRDLDGNKLNAFCMQISG